MAAAAPIFAHLHSSPLVVRRRSGAEWKSLSNQAGVAALPFGGLSSSGLEPVDIIDVKEERKLLVQCLQESKKRITWHSEVADLHTFRKVLSFGCHALHFSGHGVPGKVIFENKNCEAQFISQQELKDLLLAGGMERRQSAEGREVESKTVQSLVVSPSPKPPSRLRSILFRRGTPKSANGILGDATEEDDDEIQTTETERGWISLHPPPRVPVKLVFLSACHSESVAEAFVSAGVPHVIVVSKDEKVLDKKAMEFSKAFYTALFAGHSVARAFEIGQVQADISITRDAGNSKFKLLGHGDHSEPLFRDTEDGSFIENALRSPTNDCDAVAEVFVGRSVEVHQVFKSLVDGARLVSITGNRGIGKTEVALQCAQYATERRVYKHIYFARLEESTPLHPNSASVIAHIAQAFGASAQTELELANAVRQLCVSGSYLLILDGCNRRTRRDPQFRAIVAQLLRRVSDLSILITGDGKIGAMDGVGEKIIQVDHLPPADAALLFTLRAPRRLKAHEMGGSSDLVAFAEHPIIRSLMGHPRSICAVAQFLEKKDMELDKHEFLNYIIPSVMAGLASDQSMEDNMPCLSASVSYCHEGNDDPHHHHHLRHHHHQHQPPHFHTHGHHHNLHERWQSMPSIPLKLSSNCENALDLAVSLDSIKLESARSDPGSSVPHERSDGAVDDLAIQTSRPKLELSQSDMNIGGGFLASQPEPISTATDLYVLKIVDSLKLTVADEEGRVVWANAVVSNSLDHNHSSSLSMLQQVDSVKSMPIDWLAPFISRYFATKLKADAAKRPLSVRSIDFLSKSTLVWGTEGRSPAQSNGIVDLEMFAHFWRWFAPLTECIALSRLWSFTQPRLIHGFLSKGECVTMLQRAPVGTFLIRFSETRLRCFVIVYVTELQTVQFVPVECQDGDSDGGWYVALQEDRNGATFPTIHDLVLSVTVLRFLFPQTPKEIAFAK